MKYWMALIALQAAILALGFGAFGSELLELELLGAPVVNLLLWTSLVSLAGLAASAAVRRWHRVLGRILLVIAIAWFPTSLMIFGNARFSGTTDLLWQAWLYGSAALLLTIVWSLAASGISGLMQPGRRD
ncbi:MAG: hypothetical protein GVY11_07345 [Gammaproteobacteria bacterium]|jgi:hypothetical protein|nr:hypothetical protein [Gammaproteobacteria bacterium]